MYLMKYLLRKYLFPNEHNKFMKVLMVTGAYYPEVSGAANQCLQIVNTLREKVNFMVLTTTRNPDLPYQDQVEGINVFRVHINNKSVRNYCLGILKFTTFFLSRRRDFQIVHLHGFSLKSAFLILLSKIFHKKTIIKMTSVGHDDPISCGKRGFPINYFFLKADNYVGVSPQFEDLYRKSGLPLNRYKQISNGVDINLFQPVTDGRKIKLRVKLGLPEKMKLILCVGHFSREKCPEILLHSWKQYVADKYPDSGIIFVGSTNPDHYEVDTVIVEKVERLAKLYQNKRVFFIEETHEIEKYYQASDLFVLPSLREGLPNALLEAMSCELLVIASRLEGVTDWVIKDGVNGLLFTASSIEELGRAITRILSDETFTVALGRNARKIILERFMVDKVAEDYKNLYDEMI